MIPNRSGRSGVLSIAAVALLSSALPARAVADGTPLAAAASASVFGSAVAVGNTLMEHDGTTNFALRVGGSDAAIDLSMMPADATVVRAFLFWAGTHDSVGGVDSAVDFELPDGTFFNDLSTSSTTPGEPSSTFNRCVTRTHVIAGIQVPMFSCRREITWLVQQLGAGGAVGTYHVEDVNASPGDCAIDPTTCQAKFGGWGVVVMWESPTEAVRRDLVLADAFFAVDEQGSTGGGFSAGISPEFSMSGFTIGPTADGEFTFMGFEGDAQLGVPPQDLAANPNRCNDRQCADFIRLRTPQNATFTRLNDVSNRPGNLLNGSNNRSGGTHPGLDIDTFDIGPSGLNILRANDTQLSVQAGSGDGVADDGSGGSGEMFLLGFALLSVETFSPRFQNAGTEKVVLEPVAGTGEVLNYILRVENNGSASAANTIVKDQLPAGVTYVANSTTNTCGVTSNDVAGTSPLLRAQGLNIGTMTIGERCEVRFRVTVNDNVSDGTVLQNFFTVEAATVAPISIGPATTTIDAAELGQPQKSVAVQGGGDPAPGATLVYTIRIPNVGTRTAPSVSVVDDLPAELQSLAVTSLPAGATDLSNAGTGHLEVRNISIGAGQTAVLTFTAQIRNNATAGTAIANQADVDQPSLAAPLLTDDPNVNVLAQDPTVIVVAQGVSLVGSTKIATDVNGGQLVPGDVVEFRVTANKTGSTPTVIDLLDHLPPNVQGCTVVSAPPGGFLNCQAGGANGTGLVTGAVAVTGAAVVDFVFRVTVSPTAPDGFLLQNGARLTPLADPALFVDVSSAPLVVFSRASLSTSTKDALDQNGAPLRPNDLVTYTITARNDGSQPATNVVVTDTVPSPLVVTQVLDGGAQVGSTITWSIPSLAVGASASLRFEARVPVGTANGTVISNAATLTPDAPAAAFTTPPAVLTVVAAPILTAQKTVADLGAPPFRPDDVVRYTITLTNSGDGAAQNVAVADTIDAAFSSVILSGGGALVGGDATFDATTTPALASVAPGASVVLTFDARLAPALVNGTVVNNQARITANGVALFLSDDPSTVAPLDPTRFTVTSQAVLAMEKTWRDVNAGATLPGDELELSLVVRNTGDAPATDTVVTDTLDPRFSFVSSPDGGALVGADVVFAAVTVMPGAPRTLRFTVRTTPPLSNGTAIPNQASAASPVAATVVSDDPTTPAPLDPTVIVIESRPVLDTLEKTVLDLDGDGVFEPGDAVRYTIVVENTGSEDAINVVVTDAIPAALDAVVPGQGGVLSGNTVTWSLGTLAAGASLTLTIDANVRRPLADATIVDNQARVLADNHAQVPSDDPTTAVVDDPTRFVVVSNPSVLVEKTVVDMNGAPVRPGDVLAYTIRMTARGGRDATGLSITDAVDASLTNVIALDGGTFAAGTLTWSLATLVLDTSAEVRFTAQVLTPLQNGTLINNQASVALAEPGVPGAPFLSDDPNTAAPNDPTRVQVVSAANLSVTTMESTDDGGAPVTTRRPGERVRYAIVVQNSGDAPAQDVVVTVPAPPELQFVSAAGGAFLAGQVRFDALGVPALALVNPGDAVPLTIVWDVVTPLDNGAIVSAQASLDAEGLAAPFSSDDPSTALPEDPTTFTILSAPALTRFEKAVADESAAPIEPGDVVRYTLVLENTGDAIARATVITDTLPPELEIVDAGGATVAGQTLTFTVGDVAPGAPALRTIRARVLPSTPSGAVVANQASAQATSVGAVLSDDPATGAAADPTTFVVTAVPRVTVEKDVDQRIRAPDEPLAYTLTVTSTGSGPTLPAALTDVLPAGLVDITPSPGAAFDPGTNSVSVTVPALPPGATFVVTIGARVDATVPNGTVLSNQAFVTGPDTGVVPSNDPQTAVPLDPTVVLIDATPVLTTSTKTATDENGGQLVPGDTVRFVLTVQNTGNGVARDVRIVDDVDAGFEIVSVENGGAAAGDVIVWDASGDAALAAVQRGQAVSVAFVARVRADVPDGAVLANQGSITSLDVAGTVLTDDPATPAASDPTRVVVRAPSLVLEKTFLDEDGAPFEPGDTFIYAIRVRNDGGAPLLSATLTDVLPSALTAPDVQDGGTLAGGVATWTLPNVAAGAELVVRVRGTLDALAQGGSVVENQAELVSPSLPTRLASDDPATPAPRDPTRAVVTAEERFEGAVELFDGDTGAPIATPVIPGQRIRARIRFANVGNQTALAVVLRSPFPSELFAIDETTAGGVILEAGPTQVATWSASQNPALAQMPPGESFEVEVEGAIQSPIADGIEIPVFGEVTSVSTATPVIIGPAVLRTESAVRLSATTKEVIDDDGGLVEPGDVLTYRITALNDGGVRAEDVVVRDPIPSGTIYVGSSTRVRGVPIDDDNGGAPTQAGLLIGDLEAGQAVVVDFKVRVTLEAPRGLRIDNQAFLTATGAPQSASDNPLTPLIEGDATSVIVGGGSALVVSKTASVPRARVGEALRFDIRVENIGTEPARGIVIRDSTPVGTTLVPGSLRVDDRAVTDALDRDDAEVDGALVRAHRDALEAGEGMTLSFEVVVNAGTASVLNQATVLFGAGTQSAGSVQSDGDLALPGVQPTVVPVEGERALLFAPDTTTLSDDNGAVLRAGDPVTVATIVQNLSGESARVDAIDLEVSNEIVVDAASIQDARFAFDEARRRVRLADGVAIDLEPGASIELRFAGAVVEEARTGDVARVVSSAHARSLDGEIDRAIDLGVDAITVGLVAGTGALEGTLFLEGGARDGRFDPKVDERARQFTVLAFRGGARDAVQTAVSDEDGRYRLQNIPAGRYRLELRSTAGAAFGVIDVGNVGDGEVLERDVEVDATGSVYRTDGERPAQGARVYLFLDDGDTDPLNDTPVAETRLGEGQQGQLVSAQGLYRFDVAPGRYRIGVIPDDALSVFPSAAVPVQAASNGHPLGAVVPPDEFGDMSRLALVKKGDDAPYTLRFAVRPDALALKRNHIPLDALKEQLMVTKTANRKRVSVGDIVSYAVRVENRALGGVSDRSGGIEIVDTLPSGLRLIEGSYRLDRIEKDKKGQERRSQLRVQQRGTRTMTFGPFALSPATSYELRYNVVIGPGTPPGEHENTAAVRMADGQVPLSERVGARVQVVPDAIFDLGTARAKVFCDDDGDGWQDAGERGLPGTRMYIDVGAFGEADVEGRTHFTALQPGMHMIKLDERTLPPGASIDEPRRSFYLSAGLPAQVSFGARCLRVENAAVTVSLNEDAYRTEDAPRTRTLAIEGTAAPVIRVDGVELALPRVDLGVAIDGEEPAFAGAPGPNLGGVEAGALRPRLVFSPRAEGPAAVAWQLLIEDDAGAPVWVFAAQGAPPASVSFDGTDPVTGLPVLTQGARYHAVLAVGFAGGDRAQSAPRPFAVRFGEPVVAPGASATSALLGEIDEQRGPLFSATGKPSRRLLSWLGEHAASIKAAAGVVTVKAHTDVSGAASESLTAERAAAVVRALAGYGVAVERLHGVGAGDHEPKVPNLRKMDRVKNRRVVLSMQTVPDRYPPVEARKGVAGARVGESVVALAENGAFTHSATLPFGGALVVEVTSATGARVRALRVIDEGPIPATTAMTQAKGASVGVSWTPGAPLLIGGEPREIGPLLSARIKTLELADDGRARLSVSGPTTLYVDAPGLAVTSWSARVLDDAAGPERVLWETTGVGALPPSFSWDGRGSDGAPTTAEGRALKLRLVVTNDVGEVAISPDVRALATDRYTPAPSTEERFPIAVPFDAKGNMKDSTRQTVNAIAREIASTRATVRISTHVDDSAPRVRRLAITQQQADALKEAFIEEGVGADQITAIGKGSDEPLAPNVGKKNKERNRRVEIVVVRTHSNAAPAFVEGKSAVRVNGTALAVEDGAFRGAAPALTSGEVTIDLETQDGARATVRQRPAAGDVWQGDPAAFDAWTHATPVPSDAPSDAPTDAAPLAGAAPDPNGGVDGGAALPGDAGAPEPAALAQAGADAGPRVGVDPKSVGAAKLTVELPSSLSLASRRVLVRGRTAPDNRVRVGQTDVVVDPLTGNFQTVADVPEGDSTLSVVAIDPLGNTGAIDTPVTVDSRGWFALLMADSALGQDGAQLDERSTYTSTTIGDTFLYGRGVAYVKGNFTGPALFRDYDLTLHADTRRWQQDVFDRDVLDPDRFYPLYGDSSLEVVDGSASGLPLYVALQADASTLQVGSVRTQLQGGDLFRYTRARPGAQLTFDRGWTGPLTFGDRKVGASVAPLPKPETDPFRTTVTTFIEGGGGQRHARVELMGTGSSVYFLRHERVIEGSERVAVIVRDGVTGSEIGRTALARNLDYTIRYDEGRVLLKAPLGAFSDAAFIANQNLGQVTGANRVFLEVNYEHQDDDPFLGTAAGAQGKQVVFGHAEIGGGYVYEGREDGALAYQLGGGHLKLFVDEGTFIRAELAGSQSVDAGNFVSFDGGLSYAALGQGLETKDGQIGQVIYPAERKGIGFKLDGQAQVGDWLGRAKSDAMARAYFQRLEPGFFADANIVEQGQTKWGGEGAWQVWDPGKLRVRYDGVISEIPSAPPLTEFRTLQRHIATGRYEHRLVPSLLLAGEYGYGYTHDSGAFVESAIAEPRSFHTNVVAGGFDWQVIEVLTLSLKQEGILTGDPNQLRAWNDHLITHAQVKLRATEEIAILTGVSVRWSGENQATAGVSWAVTKESRLYVNERIGYLPQPGQGTMGFTSTSVVGAETELAPGSRGYAEYQLEGAFAGQQSRGVAGLASLWRLPFGFALHFGYERIMTLGGLVPPTENGTLPPGAFTDGTFYATPGANGGGSFVYGEGSRDAFSVGLEFKRGETVVASQRFELRYDNMSEARGGKDRLWFLSGSAAAVRLSPELSLLARYNIGLAQDLALAMREAYLEDGVFGVAYRPVTHDWVSVLTKLSRRVDVRPLNLELGTVDDYTAHAVSIEPIVELPWKVQIAEKVALKHARLLLDDMPEANALTGLWINRLNWHLLSTLRGFGIDPFIPGEIDFGAEYRVLYGITAQTMEHGPLFELQVAPMPYFRLGVGWNFTRFSDDVLDRGDVDRSGFFVRAVGTF